MVFGVLSFIWLERLEKPARPFLAAYLGLSSARKA